LNLRCFAEARRQLCQVSLWPELKQETRGLTNLVAEEVRSQAMGACEWLYLRKELPQPNCRRWHCIRLPGNTFGRSNYETDGPYVAHARSERTCRACLHPHSAVRYEMTQKSLRPKSSLTLARRPPSRLLWLGCGRKEKGPG
jgi:hypothetical protein